MAAASSMRRLIHLSKKATFDAGLGRRSAIAGSNAGRRAIGGAGGGGVLAASVWPGQGASEFKLGDWGISSVHRHFQPLRHNIIGRAWWLGYNPAVPAGLLHISHGAFMALYLGLPPLVLVTALVRRLRRDYAARAASLGIIFSCGIVLGAAVAVSHALLVGAPVPLEQVLLASYFAVGLLLIIRGLDAAVGGVFGWLGRTRAPAPAPVAPVGAEEPVQPVAPRRRRDFRIAPLLRFAVLVVVGFPFVVMTMACFRARVVPLGDPLSRLGIKFREVRFASADGLTLAGWWIPAMASEGELSPDASRHARETVLICHGFWGGKAGPLPLARFYLGAGYNVLLFDFRATGQSEGNLCTFGALEQLDVLGAVDYLQHNQPQASRRIVGLGLGTGGAALLGAAADRSPQGRAIAAVAVVGCYDDLSDLTHEMAATAFLPPLSTVVWKVGLPLGSLETGIDLETFRPADAVGQIWPRPVMVVHGTDDTAVPFSLGQRLFDAASMPKRFLWLGDADADQTAADPGVNREIIQFFNEAKPVPVI